jgi:hypothetical protein
MSFLRPSVSFTRFKLGEPVPAELWNTVSAKLKQFAFVDIDNIPEERSFGWVNFDDMLDAEWTISGPEKGHYLAFSLRLDTRRISPAVLRKHIAMAMREEERRSKEDGKSFISHTRKKEIRESVRARLMARTLPIPAEFNVIWDTQQNIVTLASTHGKVIELFCNHFAATFDLPLEQLTPYSLGVHLLGENITVKLDALTSTTFA